MAVRQGVSTRGLPLGIILVLVEVRVSDLVGGDSLRGNLCLCTPSDCVQDDRTKVIMAPVAVKVSSGESEAATTVRALVGPGQMLYFTPLKGGLYVLVAGVKSISPSHGAGGRVRGENGSDPLHFLPEAHVEVPFITNLEWLNTACDRVFWKFLEVCIPVGVD